VAVVLKALVAEEVLAVCYQVQHQLVRVHPTQ
jgi:hypothetical protein